MSFHRPLAAFLNGIAEESPFISQGLRAEIGSYNARAAALDDAYDAALDFNSTRFDDALARARANLVGSIDSKGN